MTEEFVCGWALLQQRSSWFDEEELTCMQRVIEIAQAELHAGLDLDSCTDQMLLVIHNCLLYMDRR
jgi:hypothetical protein